MHAEASRSALDALTEITSPTRHFAGRMAGEPPRGLRSDVAHPTPIDRMEAARDYWQGLSARERVGRFPYLNCTADWSRLGGFGRRVLLADVARREEAGR
jgi:hypothetical protein